MYFIMFSGFTTGTPVFQRTHLALGV